MGRGDETVGGSNDFTRDTQCLQRCNQRKCTVGEERDVPDTEVLAERLLQFLVETPSVGQLPACPDLLQVGKHLLQGWQKGSGDVNRIVLQDTCSLSVADSAARLSTPPAANPWRSVGRYINWVICSATRPIRKIVMEEVNMKIVASDRRPWSM